MKAFYTVFAVLVFVAVLVFLGVSLSSAVDLTTTFSWTAPGDDGTLGRAAIYDLRYTTDTLTEWSEWSEIPGVPTPALPGTVQSHTAVLTLKPGATYFFAIRAADEVPNWSDRSNVVSLFVPDTQGPTKITDFKVEL